MHRICTITKKETPCRRGLKGKRNKEKRKCAAESNRNTYTNTYANLAPILQMQMYRQERVIFLMWCGKGKLGVAGRLGLADGGLQACVKSVASRSHCM